MRTETLQPVLARVIFPQHRRPNNSCENGRGGFCVDATPGLAAREAKITAFSPLLPPAVLDRPVRLAAVASVTH